MHVLLRSFLLPATLYVNYVHCSYSAHQKPMSDRILDGDID